MEKFVSKDNLQYNIEKTKDYVENYVTNAISTKQDTLVNQENIKSINGESLLGSGDIIIGTNRAFPAEWPTTNSTTTKAFCDIVNSDSSAIMGMSYLGEVRWSDLPASLINAEVVVEIMSGTGTSNKVIHLILTSGNREPYRWEYTYWNNGNSLSGWIGFQPQITSNNQLSSDLVDDVNHNHKFVTNEMYNYLDDLLYEQPVIDVFDLYYNNALVPTTNEKGTTLTINQISHRETNTGHISGNLIFNNESILPVTNTTLVNLSVSIPVTTNTVYTLSGTNTKGNTFGRSVSITFNEYAYTCVSNSSTTPTTGLTKQSTLSTFANSGATISYNSGDYIYFYTKTNNQKIQVYVLGQWADVETDTIGTETITLNNGTTANYYIYRIGPFTSSGEDKYRVVS